jgi:hypothetical protein
LKKKQGKLFPLKKKTTTAYAKWEGTIEKGFFKSKFGKSARGILIFFNELL